MINDRQISNKFKTDCMSSRKYIGEKFPKSTVQFYNQNIHWPQLTIAT